MDEVFKALSDPSRRLLMDRLFDDDGQTLGQLCEHLPEMTRFGVMNHLKVLEAAGLVRRKTLGRTHLIEADLSRTGLMSEWLGSLQSMWALSLNELDNILTGEEE